LVLGAQPLEKQPEQGGQPGLANHLTINLDAADRAAEDDLTKQPIRVDACKQAVQGAAMSAVRCLLLDKLRQILLLAILAFATARAAETKRVLMVHSFVSAAPPFTTSSDAFQNELLTKFGAPLDLDEVSLNFGRYAGMEMEEALVDFMRQRRRKWEPDLVVPLGSPAARFVAQHREKLFPTNIPVIYTGLDQRRLPAGALAYNATFVGHSYDLPGLVEDILQIAPDTKNIAVVIGASPIEKIWKEIVREEYQRFTNRVSFIWFDDSSYKEMLDRSSTLPPHSFLLLVLLIRDAKGISLNADEALKRFHEVANAPINSIFKYQLGLGTVGGRLYDEEGVARNSAQTAIRILRGEPVTNFPPKIVAPLRAYDWRELKRWGIRTDRLPAGSSVLFREPTAWERYKGRIMTATVLFLAQAGLIVLLQRNLKKRRRIETELREIRKSASLAGDAAHMGMLRWDTSDEQLWTSDKWREIHGFGPKEQVTFQNFLSCVHLDDRELVELSMRNAAKRKAPYSIQHRIVRPDGQVRWISKNGRGEALGNNGSTRVLGIAIDITEQIVSEAASRELSGRLINAQDEERKRIARDIHDDLSQRLVMLAAQADLLSRMDHRKAAQPLIDDISEQVKSLSTEVHNLSYQLYPARLEQLGLVEATRALCDGQSKIWNIPIDFVQAEIPRELNKQTALAIYRIVQEALQNIGKHSAATHVRVELTRLKEAVRLSITDNGRGFDIESVKAHAGLGLLGIRERAHLARGKVTVQSEPGKGTQIEVIVRIDEESSSLITTEH
jgi:PAS domain S-box-containing protein